MVCSDSSNTKNRRGDQVVLAAVYCGDNYELITCMMRMSGMQAMIKPRERGDFDGWHRTPIERVAYLLNLLLGLDYVPPTVYRQDLQVDGQVYPHGGAVIFFVDNLMLLENVPENDWGCCKEGFLSDTRVLVRHSNIVMWKQLPLLGKRGRQAYTHYMQLHCICGCETL